MKNYIYVNIDLNKKEIADKFFKINEYYNKLAELCTDADRKIETASIISSSIKK